jgi:hypothetical protein
VSATALGQPEPTLSRFVLRVEDGDGASVYHVNRAGRIGIRSCFVGNTSSQRGYAVSGQPIPSHEGDDD